MFTYQYSSGQIHMEWHEMVIPKLLYIIARYSGLFYLLSVSFFDVCIISEINSTVLLAPIQNRYAEVSHHVRHLKIFIRTYYSYLPDVRINTFNAIIYSKLF
ncbi:hypothetical protein BDQ17DRAFT_829565 [Cyathus striatus]|nr:hypothetical protein BDQ17DRAFT_829565 [Cyathus striatus]